MLTLTGDTVTAPLECRVELALDEFLVCGRVCAVQMVDTDASTIANMTKDKDFRLDHAMVITSLGTAVGGLASSLLGEVNGVEATRFQCCLLQPVLPKSQTPTETLKENRLASSLTRSSSFASSNGWCAPSDTSLILLVAPVAVCLHGARASKPPRLVSSPQSIQERATSRNMESKHGTNKKLVLQNQFMLTVSPSWH